MRISDWSADVCSSELVAELTAREIGLKVLAGEGASIDTTTANGRLIFGIFAALAEFERELIVERTKAGLAAARSRGRKGGRPFRIDRKSVVWGKGVSIRVAYGGRGVIQKKK